MLANEILGTCGVGQSDEVTRSESSDHMEDGHERGKQLVELLLRVLEEDGSVGAAREAGDCEQAELRLSASCALLKLARIQSLRVDVILGPHGWRRLACCMRDENAEVRAAIARKLHAEQMRNFKPDKREASYFLSIDGFLWMPGPVERSHFLQLRS